MYKLICGNDPRKSGIENDAGDWELDGLVRHMQECEACRDYVLGIMESVTGKNDDMYVGRYQLPDGRWQTWAVWESFSDAFDAVQFHAQGRPFEILAFDTWQRSRQ